MQIYPAARARVRASPNTVPVRDRMAYSSALRASLRKHRSSRHTTEQSTHRNPWYTTALVERWSMTESRTKGEKPFRRKRGFQLFELHHLSPFRCLLVHRGFRLGKMLHQTLRATTQHGREGLDGKRVDKNRESGEKGSATQKEARRNIQEVIHKKRYTSTSLASAATRRQRSSRWNESLIVTAWAYSAESPRPVPTAYERNHRAIHPSCRATPPDTVPSAFADVSEASNSCKAWDSSASCSRLRTCVCATTTIQ